MFRNVEALLFSNSFHEGLLKTYEELVDNSDDDEIRAHHDEIKALVVSKTKRNKVERYFDAKVDFMVEKDRLDRTEGLMLKKLHDYRNELYTVTASAPSLSTPRRCCIRGTIGFRLSRTLRWLALLVAATQGRRGWWPLPRCRRWGACDVEVSADGLHAVPEAGEAGSAVRVGASDAVVADRQVQGVVLDRSLQVDD